MPAPTPLTIATSSLARLVKEEASYHAELRQQEEAIRSLESTRAGGQGQGQGQGHAEEREREDGDGGEGGGNDEFLLRQLVGGFSCVPFYYLVLLGFVTKFFLSFGGHGVGLRCLLLLLVFFMASVG